MAQFPDAPPCVGVRCRSARTSSHSDGVHTQASTDMRPKPQSGKPGEEFNLGNFFKGDLPGKLALILVSTCFRPLRQAPAFLCCSLLD